MDCTGVPAASHSWKESQAATGTPIKLTKSLPAKAMAKAKVPDRITTRHILTLHQ